jgi:hypothetical protein
MALSGDGSAQELLRRAERGVLLYGITPPSLATTPGRADEIAQATLARLDSVALDGLIVYDVDAESDRSPDARPFPFMPMMDPADFMDRHLSGWTRPVVVYRAVGKYTQEDLSRWLTEVDADRVLTVLVGAASRHQAVKTRLTDAYRVHAGLDPRPGIGGVCIAERHVGTDQEHRRMLSKQDEGCDFFVSQVCYDLDHSRDLLSDYVYLCRDEDKVPRPVILTLAPCGSMKTLEFMSWLGIDVPRWLHTELSRSHDPLIGFCRRLGLPFGINVESLTNRKVEIEASVDLVREIRELLR